MQHTIQDLKMRQALPLEVKVRMTQQRIREWVSEFGEDGVYVSFSGGKDSTVLLHLARKIYPDIPTVFIDTGLEYPEVREFVKTFDNITWVKPSMNFKQVIEKYGYPFVSKEVSKTIRMAKPFYLDPTNPRYKNKKALPVQEEGETYVPLALLKLRGQLKTKRGEKSMYCCDKWEFLLDAPFDVSEECCNIMKKKPTKKYEKETGRKPILATLAEESRLRTAAWLTHGCNAFESSRQQSTPMAFWTEQDVLKYIKDNNLPIASIYGDVVYEEGEEIQGQMDFSELGLASEVRCLKTTGFKRTGCMFCAYGCHLEKSPNRFEIMKEIHPKQYDYIMRPKEQGGLNYKEVIDWINEHGNLNIKY